MTRPQSNIHDVWIVWSVYLPVHNHLEDTLVKIIKIIYFLLNTPGEKTKVWPRYWSLRLTPDVQVGQLLNSAAHRMPAINPQMTQQPSMSPEVGAHLKISLQDRALRMRALKLPDSGARAFKFLSTFWSERCGTSGLRTWNLIIFFISLTH